LLRAGFCLPPTLPPARCALTAPFHPYPPPLAVSFRWRRATARRALSGLLDEARQREVGRYIFCATVRQVTLPGRYPAHCPAESGLSSRPRPSGFGAASPPPFRRRPHRLQPGCASQRSSGQLRQSSIAYKSNVLPQLSRAADGEDVAFRIDGLDATPGTVQQRQPLLRDPLERGVNVLNGEGQLRGRLLTRARW
jgi:hypothetical protein